MDVFGRNKVLEYTLFQFGRISGCLGFVRLFRRNDRETEQMGFYLLYMEKISGVSVLETENKVLCLSMEPYDVVTLNADNEKFGFVPICWFLKIVFSR